MHYILIYARHPRESGDPGRVPAFAGMTRMVRITE